MHPEHDLAQHVPGREALVGLGGFGQLVGRGDHNLRPRHLHGAVEMLELAQSSPSIIGNDLNAAPLLRLGLDAVWIGDPAAVANRFEAACERIAPGEREHGGAGFGKRDGTLWPCR